MPLEITGYRPHSLDPPLSLSSIVISPTQSVLVFYLLLLLLLHLVVVVPVRDLTWDSLSNPSRILFSCRARIRNFSLLAHYATVIRFDALTFPSRVSARFMVVNYRAIIIIIITIAPQHSHETLVGRFLYSIILELLNVFLAARSCTKRKTSLAGCDSVY